MGFLRAHRFALLGSVGALLLPPVLLLFGALGWPGELDEQATPSK